MNKRCDNNNNLSQTKERREQSSNHKRRTHQSNKAIANVKMKSEKEYTAMGGLISARVEIEVEESKDSFKSKF